LYVNVWRVEYEHFEDFAAVEEFQDPEQFPELVEDKSVYTKKWYRRGTDLWAEFGDEIPFGEKKSSQRIR
jgi:hypothetical protein